MSESGETVRGGFFCDALYVGEREERAVYAARGDGERGVRSHDIPPGEGSHPVVELVERARGKTGEFYPDPSRRPEKDIGARGVAHIARKAYPAVLRARRLVPERDELALDSRFGAARGSRLYEKPSVEKAHAKILTQGRGRCQRRRR